MTDTIPTDWVASKLEKHLVETKTRVGFEEIEPFSVSKVLGIVPQKEKFKKRVAAKDISNYKIIQNGDFAYDPMLLWDGSINRMERNELGAISPAYVSFQVKSEALNSDYFRSLLKSHLMAPKYKAISKGTNVRRQKAEFSDFKEIEILLPPLGEQEKIADILTSVDDTIEHTEAQVAKLQDLKTATMNELLTRGIGHTEFRESELGLIPTTWEIKKISDLLRENPRYGAGASAESSGEFRYIRITDIDSNGQLSAEDQKFISTDSAQGYELLDDDLLIARTGATVGKSYLHTDTIFGKFAFAGYLILFRFDLRKALPKYVYYFTHSQAYYRWIELTSRTGAQPNINATEYSSLNLPVPPLGEQEKIADILTSLDDQIESIELKLVQLESLKKSLMGDLLTGRVRVSVD